MTLRARFAALAALLAVALVAQPEVGAQDKEKDKEKNAKAKATAIENMKRIKVDNPTVEESDNFIVVGSFSKEKAQALSKVLEKTLPVARKAAGYTDKDTAWSAKLTVYFLPDSDEFKSFMRKVLQTSPDGLYIDVRAEPPLLVDPAEMPGKPADADLFAATASRVAGALLQAKGGSRDDGSPNVPAWLRDGFGRVAQMKAEGPNSKRYAAYRSTVRGAVLNPKGKAPAINEAWSDAKSATVEAIGNSVAEYLAFGPKPVTDNFGKFLDALRPSEANGNPTVLTGFEALGWKDQAMADTAWKRWLQTGK